MPQIGRQRWEEKLQVSGGAPACHGKDFILAETLGFRVMICEFRISINPVVGVRNTDGTHARNPILGFMVLGFPPLGGRHLYVIRSGVSARMKPLTRTRYTCTCCVAPRKTLVHEYRSGQKSAKRGFQSRARGTVHRCARPCIAYIVVRMSACVLYGTGYSD